MTQSIGMPDPAIMMPVWPLARKSASMPRALKASAMASAVYFLPSAQSVPTVSNRLPLRLRPVAIGLVARRALFVLATAGLGAAGLACPAGGVGEPCIPNLEYNATESGATETGAQIEDRSFQCETRVCLVNHFRGRVSCPWGNTEGGSKVAEATCYVPGTHTKVTAPVKPQCADRKDNVYCSCRCGGADPAATYCQCPSGFVCDTVTNSFDRSLMRAGDKYCVREASGDLPRNNSEQDGRTCTEGCDTAPDRCGFEENEQRF